MKTIKLIALCICLLLGSHSAYVQANDQLKKEVSDRQKRVQNLQQGNADLEKLFQQAAQEAKDKVDAEQPKIDEITNGIQHGKTHEFEDYMKLFTEHDFEQKMNDIYALREDIINLNDSIEKYEAKKNRIIQKVNKNIGSLTKSKTNITTDIFTTNSAQEFVKTFDNKKYSNNTLQAVQDEYGKAKRAYQNTEKKLIEINNEKKQKVEKMNAFLEGCPECKEEYYKRFPNG